jgi:phosphoribosyl 1,2-cyclic phosphodiesterase
MSVRFWGVRGSIASPGPDTLRYGANTACVEIRCGEHLFICDAGTGLRPLGQALATEGKGIDADLLCSHTHLDHICGFPFFAPCYVTGNRIRVWAGHPGARADVRSVFRMTLTPPLSPNVMEFFKAAIEFKDFKSGDDLSPREGVSVKTGALNHPDGSTGYRIEWQGKVVAYITDTEHRAEELDANVLALGHAADIMIYDANYTNEDYAPHAGWGHSTWEEAIRLAESASVKTLVLFHHDPARTDAMLDEIAKAAAKARQGTIVAREGLTLTL